MNSDTRGLLFDEIYLPMERAWLRQWEKKGIFPFFARLTEHFPEDEKELARLEDMVTKATFGVSLSRLGIQQACAAYWSKMHAVAKKAVEHEAWRKARVSDPEDRRPAEPAPGGAPMEVASAGDPKQSPGPVRELRQLPLVDDSGPHRQDGM